MNIQVADAIWLNDYGVCRIEHLAELSGLSISEIEDLVANNVIVPEDPRDQPPTFQLRYVMTVKIARRLRDDFQLDREGLSVALTLLRRINDLESEVRDLRARLPRLI